MFRRIIVFLFVTIAASLSPGATKFCQVMDKVPIPNEKIVKSATSFLPNADNVGHRILHLNEVVINGVLHFDVIPMEIKKPFVMTIIELSQKGDETGGMILQIYHDLVSCLL